jgi:hypothetical protein
MTGDQSKQNARKTAGGMTLPAVNKESRATAARRLRVLKMQSLRSGISPKAIGFFLFECKASASVGSEAFSTAKGILYRKALRTDSTDLGGLVPIAFGANSVASALHLCHGRDPAADAARLPRPRRGLDQNRNFLLCWEAELSILP